MDQVDLGRPALLFTLGLHRCFSDTGLHDPPRQAVGRRRRRARPHPQRFHGFRNRVALVLRRSRLFLKSFNRLIQVRPRFEPEKVLAVTINLQSAKYRAPSAHEFVNRLLDGLKARRMFLQAAVAAGLPLPAPTTLVSTSTGRPMRSSPAPPRITTQSVLLSQGQGILIRGRFFTEGDNGGAACGRHQRSHSKSVFRERGSHREAPGDPARHTCARSRHRR